MHIKGVNIELFRPDGLEGTIERLNANKGCKY